MNKKICYTMEEVKEFFRDFNINRYSFDTETSSLRYTEIEITGISFCDGKSACYIPVESLLNTTTTKYIAPDTLFSYLNQTLFKDNSKDKTIIAHNIVFDGMVISKYGAYLWNAKLLYDTMVAAHLIDENRASKGLKQLVKEELGIEPTKFDEVGHNHYTKKFFQYGMDDAINTWNLAVNFAKQLKEKDLMRLMTKIESDFQKVLIEMKIEGVLIDRKFLKETTETLKESSITLTKELYRLLGEKYTIQRSLDGNIIGIKGHYNFDSPKQLSKILFGKLGLEIIERTDTGQPRTGKITINKYKKDVPFVAKLNEYKICSKLLNAFFEPMPKFIESDGKIRTNFNNVGTVTGRLSSHGAMNLQQLPHSKKEFPIETRKCFIAPESYKMIACDFSGCELRITAHLSDEDSMLEAFRNKQDLHLTIANEIWNLGIPKEHLKTDSKKYDEYKTKFKRQRSNTKACSFGLIYGISAKGLKNQIGCSEEEAQKIMDDYFETYPKIKTSINKIHQQLKETGIIRNAFGRYRHFKKNDRGFYDGKCYRQSYNFLIQSFAGDLLRMAMNKVFWLGRNNPEWGLKAIMTIHDESVMIVKTEYAEIAAKKIKECFESAVTLKIPVIADVEIGKTYADVK